MTNEQAIKWLKDYIQNTPFQMEQYERAFDMAIQALSQEPTNEKELNKAYTFGHNRGVKAYYNEQLCTVELPEAVFRYILSLVPTEEAEQEPCDDAISRILKRMWNCRGKHTTSIDKVKMEQIIRDELPVTQKSGVWVEIDDEPHEVWECDHCGFVIDGSGCIEPYEYRDTYNYCPNCGAKMESEVRNETDN